MPSSPHLLKLGELNQILGIEKETKYFNILSLVVGVKYTTLKHKIVLGVKLKLPQEIFMVITITP